MAADRTTVRSDRPPTPAGRSSTPPEADADRPARDHADQLPASDQLDQLRFIHDVARLATTARTWDELLETVVDGTRDALHADVSSLYLLDRDGAYLTLAATNGLDRFQIGRARVPFGEGVTGSVAAQREPLMIPDVKADPALPVGPRPRPEALRHVDAERAACRGTTRRSACSTSRPSGRGCSARPTSPS